MEITFADRHIQERCESERALRRAVGDKCARCVMSRLADLQAATALDEFRRLPGRCRELDGFRRGTLGIQLGAGRLLVLAPTKKAMQRVVPPWHEIDAVTILSITHVPQDPRSRTRPRRGAPR
jgi:proteic killer suppression protein